MDRISEIECRFKVGNYTDDSKTKIFSGVGVFKNYFISYKYFNKKMIVGQPNRDYKGENYKCCKNGERKNFENFFFKMEKTLVTKLCTVILNASTYK